MNLKFRIKNEKHSEAIQNRLFELGCLWVDEKEPLYFYKDKPFLYVDGKEISCDELIHERQFNNYENKLSTLDDLFDLPITKVVKNDKYSILVSKEEIRIEDIVISFDELKTIYKTAKTLK